MVLSSFWMVAVLPLLRPIMADTCKAASTVANITAGLHSIAYVTAPSREVAKKLATGIVSQHLAACVNIVPQVTSIYIWDDKLNEDSEVLMIIKTRTSKVPEMTEFIKKNHPYQVCEVISTPIEGGNPDYLNWISKQVPE